MPWLGWLAGIVFGALFAVLGCWQHTRAYYKDELAQRYATTATLAALPTATASQAIDGMRVAVRGHWLPERTVWIDNRTHQGRAGVHILTPLVLADGRWLFVDRGWAPLAARRDLPVAPPVQMGDIELQGRLARPAEGFHFGGGSATGRLWPRVDPQAMRTLAEGAQVYPALLQLEQSGGDALVRDWTPPSMGADRHRAYAAQWFSFAIIALILVAWSVRSFLREN